MREMSLKGAQQSAKSMQDRDVRYERNEFDERNEFERCTTKCKKHARQVKVGIRVEVRSVRHEHSRQEVERRMKKLQEA